jgi:NADH-quinone oxidoreductase subunit L
MENPAHYLPFILGILAAGITAFYMFRLVFLTFTGKPRVQEKFDHAHESPWTMTVPLLILAVLSFIGAGWKGPTDGWFQRFNAPYDLEAIAAEFSHLTHGTPAEHLTLAAADHHTGSEHTNPASGNPGHLEAPPIATETDPAEHGTTGHAVTEHVAAAHAGTEHAAVTDHVGDDHTHGGQAATGHPPGEHAAEHGHDAHHDIHHLAHTRAMIMSIVIAGLGILLSWLTYAGRRIKSERVQAKLPGLHHVLQKMYFFDDLYAATIYRWLLGWNALCAAFDKYVIDGIVNGSGYLTRFVSWLSGLFDNWVVDGMVNGVATVFQGAGESLRRIQTGRLQTYLVYVCFSVLLLIFIYRAL